MQGSLRSNWAALAAINGAIAVLAGAFGAHAVEAGSKPAQWLATGSQYQLIHALALIVASGLIPSAAARAAFLVGIVGFSGALYAMALGAPGWFGAIAPIGGTGFIVGWVLLAVAAIRRKAI